MLNMNSFRSTPLQQRGAGYRLVRKDSELVRNKCELNLLFFFSLNLAVLFLLMRVLSYQLLHGKLLLNVRW